MGRDERQKPAKAGFYWHVGRARERLFKILIAAPSNMTYIYNHNQVSKEVIMERLYARASVSISDLKKNPSRIINQSEVSPVAILNHNKPSAYLIPADAFEALMEKLEDYELSRVVKEREHEPSVKVSLD